VHLGYTGKIACGSFCEGCWQQTNQIINTKPLGLKIQQPSFRDEKEVVRIGAVKKATKGRCIVREKAWKLDIKKNEGMNCIIVRAKT